MVYMKKGSTPKNQQQIKKGKKAAPIKQKDDIDIDDMDDSESSDEAPQLQKTPLNKGTKGRQSLSEKKVSFSIPGKNSPAVKTPKKESSILVKKQLTPANKSKAQEEEDDDDDEDDDDFEMDEDMDDDDLDLELDEGDDEDEDGDEEDDDGDEEDDDDEEDSDEDEEGQEDIQKKLSMLKQNNGQKATPLKGHNKAKNAGSPIKGQTPKNEQPEKAVIKSKEVMAEVDRRRQRDAKMLYLGGLPTDVTSEEIKGLSDDIVDVTLPYANRKKIRTLFAFVAFNTEAKAESAYKALQSKKFRGQPLSLDFVGAKSTNRKVLEDTDMKLNLKKLHISGIPLECTIDQVAKYFKTAYQINFNQSPLFRTAMIHFNNEEAAKEALSANKEIVVSGHKLTVLYSKQGVQGKKRKSRGKNHKKNLSYGLPQRQQGGNPSKKMKFSKKGGENEE